MKILLHSSYPKQGYSSKGDELSFLGRIVKEELDIIQLEPEAKKEP